MSKSNTTWRTGLIAAAAKARAMRDSATDSAKTFGTDPATAAEFKGRINAYDTIAREFAYLASLPPHEGLEALRKLGTDSSRAWASAFAERGFECDGDDAEVAERARKAGS